MARKAKNAEQDAPNPNSVPNKDVVHRLNFMHQSAVLLASMSARAHHLPDTDPLPSSSQQTEPTRPPRRRKSRRINPDEMASVAAGNMQSVGKKATVKMDPSVKRTICQACRAVLIPGVTSSTRIEPSGPHAHFVVITCLACRYRRRFPAPPSSSSTSTAPSLFGTRRAAKDERRARRPPFFARDEHVLLVHGVTDARSSSSKKPS